MMKKIALCIISSILLISASAQNITWATPAKLQIYAQTINGIQVSMVSENLIVLYDQLKVAGELDLDNLQTVDELFGNLLDSASVQKITFTGTIPEGKFIYRDMLEEEFPVETEIHYGDVVSKIVLTYQVSNRKTSLANTFDITVTGTISLTNDLGVTRETGLDDRISFMFYQNVQTRTY
jgi:hypothetical protein